MQAMLSLSFQQATIKSITTSCRCGGFGGFVDQGVDLDE